MPPLLLLDVDGVLNALADDARDLAAWPWWDSGRARAGGRSWPIRWAPAVVDRLRGWHEAGAVELQWLTTWGHDANDELAALLGMPRLAVAGTYDDEPDPGVPEPGVAGPGRALSHAAVAPAAPDPLSGHWWKYDVVRRVLREHRQRTLVWVDDELHSPTGPFRRWADAEPRVLAVGPDPRSGLVPADLDAVAAVLGGD